MGLKLVILDKAEATGCSGELVQTHDDSLDVATLGEEFVDLFLCREEAQIAHVQSARLCQQFLLLHSRALTRGNTISFSSWRHF